MAIRSESSQKFIARNRAPRVQIEYDVELYGAQKKIELPFVMGVMADLSGKPSTELPDVSERKMLEIDIDNFNARMESIKPRVAFVVPDSLSESGGNLAVDITFSRMEDFSPEAVAKQVEPLRKLLEARTQLSNLLTYMDGKSGTEKVLDDLISNPALMKSVISSSKPAAAPDAGAPAESSEES